MSVEDIEAKAMSFSRHGIQHDWKGIIYFSDFLYGYFYLINKIIFIFTEVQSQVLYF